MSDPVVDPEKEIGFPEIPDGLWDQRKGLLLRRLMGKKGRTGKYSSPLGALQEIPLKKVYSGEDQKYVFKKSLKIVPYKIGNKNLPKTDIIVVELGYTPEECLNKAWDSLAKQWGQYWNSPAAGTMNSNEQPDSN